MYLYHFDKHFKAFTSNTQGSNKQINKSNYSPNLIFSPLRYLYTNFANNLMDVNSLICFGISFHTL